MLHYVRPQAALGASLPVKVMPAYVAADVPERVARVTAANEGFEGPPLDGACGAHDHRQVRAGTQIATKRDAVLSGQHEVEHHQVGAARFQRLAHATGVARQRLAKAFAAEGLGEQFATLLSSTTGTGSRHSIGKPITHSDVRSAMVACNGRWYAGALLHGATVWRSAVTNRAQSDIPGKQCGRTKCSVGGSANRPDPGRRTTGGIR